jgi:putative restriction endonuclease
MPADSSLEDEVRALTFAHVQQLRDRFGGRIPRDQLSLGIQLHGQRIPIWNYQRGIFKPEALGRDGAALSIQTSTESPYDDVHDPETGRFMYKYQGTDPNNAGNRALRQAMVLRRPLLYLVGVDPGFYDAIIPVYVTEDDPGRLQFTLMADQAITPPAAPESMITQVRREYVTRAVMQRLHQAQFRRIVLRAYRDRCAICRLQHPELLDAAHILPDSDPRGAPVVSNGLGMCKIHHSAYDAQILGIDPEAKVHIRVDILEEVDGPMLRYGLQEVHGSQLVLPRSAEQQPNREWLAERFEKFKAA